MLGRCDRVVTIIVIHHHCGEDCTEHRKGSERCGMQQAASTVRVAACGTSVTFAKGKKKEEKEAWLEKRREEKRREERGKKEGKRAAEESRKR